MIDKRYQVIDEQGHILASEMAFDIAVCLVKGYAETFYEEPLQLTIKEMNGCRE